MIQITNTPQKHYNKVYTITGNNLKEILEFILPKIREKSVKFYEQLIIDELKEHNEIVVDVHAGQGSVYVVKLI